MWFFNASSKYVILQRIAEIRGFQTFHRNTWFFNAFPKYVVLPLSRRYELYLFKRKMYHQEQNIINKPRQHDYILIKFDLFHDQHHEKHQQRQLNGSL